MQLRRGCNLQVENNCPSGTWVEWWMRANGKPAPVLVGFFPLACGKAHTLFLFLLHLALHSKVYHLKHPLQFNLPSQLFTTDNLIVSLLSDFCFLHWLGVVQDLAMVSKARTRWGMWISKEGDIEVHILRQLLFDLFQFLNKIYSKKYI